MRFAGTNLASYMDGPDFTGLGRTMMQGASLGRRAATQAEGQVSMAGINSTAQIKSAGYQADAIKAQGAAQGQASMASGLGNMFSGLAGGFASRGGGGGFGGFKTDFSGLGGYSSGLDWSSNSTRSFFNNGY